MGNRKLVVIGIIICIIGLIALFTGVNERRQEQGQQEEAAAKDDALPAGDAQAAESGQADIDLQSAEEQQAGDSLSKQPTVSYISPAS